MRAIPTLSVVFAVAIAIMGACVYNISYIDNSKYWGIPFHVENTSHEPDVTKLSSIPDSISKHRREIQFLADQQKYLYNKLLNATINLEKNSRLDLDLLDRIGPIANLYLRDLTRTDEAVYAIAVYEANLPADSPKRDDMSDLRIALDQEKKAKYSFLEKLSEWRQKEAEAEAERAAIKAREEYERMMNPPPIDYSVYVDPNYVEEEPVVEDINYRTSTRIYGKDSEMLGLAHAIMADIHMTQAKMASLVKLTVREYEMLDAANTDIVPTNSTYMFVRDRSAEILQEGQPLYDCLIGIYWCSRVGVVKGTTGQSATRSSPTSSKIQPGFLIPIELTNSAASKSLLFIYEPPTR